MKSHTKTNLIIIGIVFALFPIITNNGSFITGNSNESSDYNNDVSLDNENLKLSAISRKIHIINNSGWVDFRNAGNCTGNGTYSDPYVIEDLEIDGEGTGSCIRISNSDVYFKIENCTVYNSGWGGSNAGILLSHVSNSQLIDNNCSSNFNGIYFEYSNNNTISGNTANNNDYRGIYLERGQYDTISGNTANNNGYGIYLERGDYSNISGNTANNNQYAGIQISKYYNNISGNTANNNTKGLFIIGDYNTISGNTANNNYFGIDIYSWSDYNTISGNTANNNNYSGIEIEMWCDYNTISGNTAINNTRGVFLSESDFNTISGNTANDNIYDGIYLDHCVKNTISGNTMINNTRYGIYLIDSDVNIISGNTFIGNNECIVEDNCILNEFSDNGDCTYGQENGGIPIEQIIFISVISGGAVIGVATLLLLIRKRKRIE